VVSKVYLGRSLSLNLPVCDIQFRWTWHSTMDNERWVARMVINSHHAKMLFGMPSWKVRTLRNFDTMSGACCGVWEGRHRTLRHPVTKVTRLSYTEQWEAEVRSEWMVACYLCFFWTRFLGVWERSMLPLRRSIATLHPCGHIGF
jgi:hypothetical protein